MAEYNTIFNTAATGGSSDEDYNVKVEWEQDFNGDGFDDIKITITQTTATNSGTEDILGVAFDLNNLPAGTEIQDISTGLIPGETDPGATLSTFTPDSAIDEGNVSDGGPTDPGFSTSGGSTAEPYDAFVAVSANGSGEGIVQTFSFIISNPTQDLDGPSLLNNTDWWVRTSSTDGGSGSSKTADVIGELVMCFAAGTLISTPDGEVAVETLGIGDPILTASGEVVPVKWVGLQTVRKTLASPNMEPVRIRAGAIEKGVPHTDLVVTADHGMIIEDYVVNASALVNGDTIDWVPMSELPQDVTYYHIETEHHDEILANGAQTETFVDYLGRQGFDNYQEYLDLYGAERIIPEMTRIRVSAKRQLPKHIGERFAVPSFDDQVTEDFHAAMKLIKSA